jgi:cytochrome bd-type quinol oxidase subunit 2
MFKRIRKTLAVFAASLAVVAAPAVIAAPAVSAQTNPIQDNLKCGTTLSTNQTSGCDVTSGTTGINNIITTVVNVFSVVVGVVSVIMIIYGGFRYVTSGGDSGNVSNAKNTIIYAIVGLVVVALAQFIVQFVLDKVTQVGQ